VQPSSQPHLNSVAGMAVINTRDQYPIMLAWAVTTDKVQGLSLHNSVILGVIFGMLVKPILL